ncbi:MULTISPECIES: acyl carrier protein [unclassified Streptomyces]|uniref:acyl carrier protein n=1 Tax=unclassified Streptomyces TaxID=2593676 RepID=UPI00332F2C23
MENTQLADLERHIAAVLVQAIAEDLEVDAASIDQQARFTDLGLDSAGLIAVSERVSEELTRKVETEEFFEHVSVVELARHLAGRTP